VKLFAASPDGSAKNVGFTVSQTQTSLLKLLPSTW
jgi:hypothetical protein